MFLASMGPVLPEAHPPTCLSSPQPADMKWWTEYYGHPEPQEAGDLPGSPQRRGDHGPLAHTHAGGDTASLQGSHTTSKGDLSRCGAGAMVWVVGNWASFAAVDSNLYVCVIYVRFGCLSMCVCTCCVCAHARWGCALSVDVCCLWLCKMGAVFIHIYLPA